MAVFKLYSFKFTQNWWSRLKESVLLLTAVGVVSPCAYVGAHLAPWGLVRYSRMNWWHDVCFSLCGQAFRLENALFFTDTNSIHPEHNQSETQTQHQTMALTYRGLRERGASKERRKRWLFFQKGAKILSENK